MTSQYQLPLQKLFWVSLIKGNSILDGVIISHHLSLHAYRKAIIVCLFYASRYALDLHSISLNKQIKSKSDSVILHTTTVLFSKSLIQTHHIVVF